MFCEARSSVAVTITQAYKKSIHGKQDQSSFPNQVSQVAHATFSSLYFVLKIVSAFEGYVSRLNHTEQGKDEGSLNLLVST